MRQVIHAVCLAFALGGASAAFAGEGCDYAGKTAKKNDLEAPMPAAATATPEKKG
jgi:hypothetical protein